MKIVNGKIEISDINDGKKESSVINKQEKELDKIVRSLSSVKVSSGIEAKKEIEKAIKKIREAQSDLQSASFETNFIQSLP